MESKQMIATDDLVGGFASTMDRRRVLKLIAGAGALAVAGVVTQSGRAGAQEAEITVGGHYRTTDWLNLRAKPNTSSNVLAVMPPNALVEYLGETKNGFRKIAYQGTGGWAHGSYLSVSNGGSADPPTFIGQGVTTTAVNLRSGPSTGHQIHRVLSKGTVIDISDRVEYGFRYVKHNGQGGYLWDGYIAPSGGEGDGPARFTTTDRVNLRAKPSTSAKVLLVIDEGEEVLDYDLEMANGFRSVDYKGTVGWVYDAYLK
jgi:uncharacterized protein YgiM (DUF1202 family)